MTSPTNLLHDNPTFDQLGTVGAEKSHKETHVAGSEIGLFRIMVLGMDVETRNVYIQHWIDMNKNKGTICKSDTQIRFMRVYESIALVDETLTLKLQLFDVMRPDHLDMVPDADMVVILLPFGYESSAFRQRTDKFVRTLRKMIDILKISQQTFWNKTIVLLEDNYYKLFNHKSLGTFARERTKALAEITDLLTTSLGTKFSRKKKKKKVYIFERDPNHMRLKDGVDCRFALCNHITMNVLRAFTKKDLYITWLLKRHIPLPQNYVESALDYCKENEGLNETEAAELWQYLAQRNLLPNAWDKFASTFEDERLDFPIVLPTFSMNPLTDPSTFEMEKIAVSVDPANKEFEFSTQFASYGQESEPTEMGFESVSMTHSVEDTRKKKMEDKEDNLAQARREKEETAQALLEAQERLLQEQKANLKYEAERAKAELEAKRLEADKQREQEEGARKQAALEAERAKAELEAKRLEAEKQRQLEESAANQAKYEAEKAKFELEAKKIEAEKQRKMEEIAANQARMEEELLQAKLENERRLREMALIAEKQRAEELEALKKQLISDGSNLEDLKQLTQMANQHKSEILNSLQQNAAMMADAERNAQEKKLRFETEQTRLEAPQISYAASETSDVNLDLTPEPEPIEEELDYEAMEAFMKQHKLSNFLDPIVDSGVKHPNNLADMSPPQRRKLADKLGMKSSHRTRFMKACKGIEKSGMYDHARKERLEAQRMRMQSIGSMSHSPRNGALSPASAQTGGSALSLERAALITNDQNGYNSNNPPSRPLSGRLSEKFKEVGRRVSASGQQIASALKKTFTSSNSQMQLLPTVAGSPPHGPLQSSNLALAEGGRMPPPMQVHRMQHIPDDWIYIGGDYESNILRLLKERVNNLIKVDNSIRVSLQRLDESTANTKNEVILRFDEIINLLHQAKQNALRQCDEFSEQTRQQLIDICIKASNIQDRVSVCYNESYAMLHLSPADFARITDHTPIKTKFVSYTTQVLQTTMFDVSIPSILLTLHYGNRAIEIPNIEVEANVDNPSQFKDLNMSQISSPRAGGGFNLYSSGANVQPMLSTPGLQTQRVNLSNLGNMFNMQLLQSSPRRRALTGGSQSTGVMDGFSLTDNSAVNYVNTGPSMLGNLHQDQFGSQKTSAMSLNYSGATSVGSNDSSQWESSKSGATGQMQRRKKTPKMEMEKKKVEVKEEVKWTYSWLKDANFIGLSKANYDFSQENRVSCRGQGLFLAEYEIEKGKNMGAVYWEIKVVQAPSLFWVGFIEGPISEIEWEPGEYPPLDGFGIESEYGYWYVGTKYKGLGIGRVVRKADTISFKLDIDEGLCKGDVNNRDCHRHFMRGDMPDCVIPAVLCYQGRGEFIIYGENDKRALTKYG